MSGSPGFAAVLSLLLPGLGQMYRGRWIRGALMILLPIFTVLLVGAFVATYIGQALGWYAPGQGAGLIGAIVGSTIVLFIWHMVASRQT